MANPTTKQRKKPSTRWNQTCRCVTAGDLATPKDVVVVGVDDITFSDTHLQWPFPRSVEAKVIDRLSAAGAKVIAEDIQYTEPTTPMPGCGARCTRLAAREDDQRALIQERARAKDLERQLAARESEQQAIADEQAGRVREGLRGLDHRRRRLASGQLLRFAPADPQQQTDPRACPAFVRACEDRARG